MIKVLTTVEERSHSARRALGYQGVPRQVDLSSPWYTTNLNLEFSCTTNLRVLGDWRKIILGPWGFRLNKKKTPCRSGDVDCSVQPLRDVFPPERETEEFGCFSRSFISNLFGSTNKPARAEGTNFYCCYLVRTGGMWIGRIGGEPGLAGSIFSRGGGFPHSRGRTSIIHFPDH